MTDSSLRVALGGLLTTLAISALTSAYAQLPTHNPVPGGIAVLELMPVTEEQPQARFGGREVLVMPNGDVWSAVVGLPCDMLPGNYILSVTRADQERLHVELGVIPHAPPGHTGAEADVKQQQPVTPSVADTLPRDALFNASMADPPIRDPDQSARTQPGLDFRAPVESRDIVEFGRLASADGIQCHDYLSFFLAPGSQVYTPASGLVSQVDSTREDGMRIILDHGGGVLSTLGNLRAVLVESGQEVDQGEILGTVGAVDDASAGRLDWAVSLNDYRVDPLQFSASP